MQIDLKQVANLLDNAQMIYIVGDGGSAAMADHLACDLLKNCLLPAISLCSNGAVITAIGNDYSFDEVFERQLNVLHMIGDLIVIFTTSGNSKNLVQVGKKFVNVLAVSGNNGGELKNCSTYFFDLESTDQMDCEDKMSVFCHSVVRLIKERGR